MVAVFRVKENTMVVMNQVQNGKERNNRYDLWYMRRMADSPITYPFSITLVTAYYTKHIRCPAS